MFNDSGKIFSVKDAIAQVTGLNSVTSGEMVKDKKGFMGLALNLEARWTGIVMFDDNVVMAGDQLNRTFKTLSVPVNASSMGSVISPLGVMLSKHSFIGNLDIGAADILYGNLIRGVELKAPGIIVREPVYETV